MFCQKIRKIYSAGETKMFFPLWNILCISNGKSKYIRVTYESLFFPILKVLTLCYFVNYPPLDNFPLIKKKQKIYITWSNGKLWNYKQVGEINPVRQSK